MNQGVTLLGADEARTFKATVRMRLPGDAPGAGGPAVLLSPDETREFEAPVSVRLPGEVFPANAGMNRASARRNWRPSCVPRRRGDEPFPGRTVGCGLPGEGLLDSRFEVAGDGFHDRGEVVAGPEESVQGRPHLAVVIFYVDSRHCLLYWLQVRDARSAD